MLTSDKRAICPSFCSPTGQDSNLAFEDAAEFAAFVQVESGGAWLFAVMLFIGGLWQLCTFVQFTKIEILSFIKTGYFEICWPFILNWPRVVNGENQWPNDLVQNRYFLACVEACHLSIVCFYTGLWIVQGGIAKVNFILHTCEIRYIFSSLPRTHMHTQIHIAHSTK